MSNRLKFAIVFLIVNLHVFRNLSLVLYMMIYGPMVLVIAVNFLTRAYRGQLARFGSVFYLWVGFAFSAFFVSLLLISPAGAVNGLARFLFAAPIFMALVLYTDGADDLRKHLTTFVVFFAAAGLSLPLQFVVGPMSWFAESSVRAGLERYSSLIGSLTSIGVIVGCYIVLVQGMKSRFKILFVAGMIFPAVVSLNKAALVNVAIALLGLMFLNRRSMSRIMVGSTIAVTGSLLAYSSLPLVQERVVATLQSFGLQSSSNVIFRDDVSVQSSMLDRLIDLPLANFLALGQIQSPLAYLVGGGYGMGNTALVPAADALAPMAHNQYAELISVFGFVGGVVLIFVMIRIQYQLIKRSKSTASGPLSPIAVAFFIFSLNSFFANGTLYQPASASIFYLAMFAASSSIFVQRLEALELVAKVGTLAVPPNSAVLLRTNVKEKS